MIPCPFCETKLYSETYLTKHVKLRHKTLILSACYCRYEKCTRSFNNFYSYKKHFFSRHFRSFDKVRIGQNRIGQNRNPENDSPDLIELESLSCPNLMSSNTLIQTLQREYSCHEPVIFNIEDFEHIVQQEISSFVSQLYSELNLTRSFISSLFDKLKNLYDLTLIPILKDKCNSKDYKQALSDLTKMLTILQHGFDNFKSDYHSLKYFENAKTLIKPQSLKIHASVSSHVIRGKRKAVILNAEIQVISMKRVLKKFLEIPNVLSSILEHIEECKSSEPIISNIQGELWQSIESQFAGKTVFPLILYFDDIEINNPLGSHANIQKLGAVYFSLGCIPYEFSSMLENIFLAQLHYTKDHKIAGNMKIFGNIIDQITDLGKHGLTVNVGGQQRIIYFSLLTIIGDNLGLNDICGFTTSFNAQNMCRICTVDKIESRKQVEENTQMLRTEQNYLKDCENCSTGVKTKCVFNKIPKFHVIKNASLDSMHDLFEGICRYEIANILNFLINKEHFFSLEVFNARLQHFDCGRNFGKNKPISISSNALNAQYLIISASEMVFLIEHLGILIGDLVPVNNTVWEVFLMLREIINIIMSLSFTSATTQLLETLISEHHSLYMEVFADSLKPKHHFIVHYPRLLRRLGPLKHLSCFRFEAKHKQFKENAKVIKSRKNCPYTLALKHQLVLSHRFLNRKGFFDRLSLGPTLCQELTDLPDYLAFKNTLPSNIQYEYVLDTWIKINGITYHKDMAVAMHMNDNTIVFGKIHYMTINNMRQISFICTEFHTEAINRHYCAFKVIKKCETETVWKFIKLEDLFSYVPQNVHMMSDGNLYISCG